VLRSFFKDGFDRGDKASTRRPELRGEHLKRLAEAGIMCKRRWRSQLRCGHGRTLTARGHSTRMQCWT